MLKFKTSCAVLAYLSSNLLNEVGLSLFRYFEVGLRVCDIVVKKFTFAISSPDEFLYFMFARLWRVDRGNWQLHLQEFTYFTSILPVRPPKKSGSAQSHGDFVDHRVGVENNPSVYNFFSLFKLLIDYDRPIKSKLNQIKHLHMTETDSSSSLSLKWRRSVLVDQYKLLCENCDNNQKRVKTDWK